MKFYLAPITTTITLLSLSAPIFAQQAEPQEAPTSKAPVITPKPELTKVEIKGSAQDYDPRRDDTASKTVLNREEILKYGDTNVYDVLKRAPGVTVIGNSIRMRGLGNGYTQILVNGERPPPGFSMDALAPDQIEKIEVIRAATAEHSMQAIAGTINIVLTKVVSKLQRDLRLHVGHAGEQNNAMLMGTLADRAGKLSYYLSFMLSRNDDKSPSLSSDLFTTPEGQVIQSRQTRSLNESRNTSIGAYPRLSWKFDNTDQLHVSGFLQSQHGEYDYVAATTNRVGTFPTPDYVNRQSDNRNRSQFYGGSMNWVATLGGGKLDAKLNVSRGQVTSASRSLATTADSGTTLQRDTDGVDIFTNYGTSGKYTRTILDNHSLAAGWEASRQATEQSSVRVEGLITDLPVRTAELFNPQVTKLAAYAQDEWNITKNWSVYQGVRWEGIQTESVGSGLLTTQSRNQVLSPVVQTLYKFPGKGGRQLRLALTRTFKAPSIGQLSARRYESVLNTRFNPDSSGNPGLRPELANGLDLTYEHFWFPGAVFSISASARQIKDYIRSRLAQDSGGHWLIQPLNDGNAQVRTLDVELKFPLRAVMKDTPPLDFRASVNRNWSQVDSVPGPDNRLDQQVPLSAVLGLDYRADKFNTGVSFSFREGGPVRISEQQSARMQLHRDLEAYLLYKFTPGLQLRVAVSNALGEDNRTESRYDDSSGSSQTFTSRPGSPRLQANLEIKF